jgi:hypothetical protein
VKVLQPFWEKRADGVFAIIAMQGIDLLGPNRDGQDFFPIHNDLLVVERPPILGTIQSVMGQSVVPIVASVKGESTLRCVGTGFFISCSGLLVTAAHVVIDPIDSKYGKTTELGDLSLHARDLNFGILIANNPVFNVPGYSFLPFEWSVFLAERRDNPLPIAGIDLKLTSDIAICKVPPRNGNFPHQPLTIVQPGIIGTGMKVGSMAYALGYAGMEDFEIELNEHGQILGNKKFRLHGSVGKILERFPDNLDKKDVSTPGPCFSFEAKIPGGMSGGPIFDREGIYVHGVVSKGWEDEAGPTRFSFGSMLAPLVTPPDCPYE